MLFQDSVHPAFRHFSRKQVFIILSLI